MIIIQVLDKLSSNSAVVSCSIDVLMVDIGVVDVLVTVVVIDFVVEDVSFERVILEGDIPDFGGLNSVVFPPANFFRENKLTFTIH